MNAKFEFVKKMHDAGQWGDTAVKNAVKRGWITEDEYAEITGAPYEKEA